MIMQCFLTAKLTIVANVVGAKQRTSTWFVIALTIPHSMVILEKHLMWVSQV